MSVKAPRRGPPGVITILAAMLASMAFGYYAGSVFGSNRAPQPASADTDTAVSTNPTAYYAEGTTVFGQPFKAEPVCLNTCKQAKNNRCDDGRREPRAAESKVESFPGPIRMVTCDLGTDCDDCGPWTPSGHAPWISGSQPGPIARLMEQEIEVRARPVGMGLGFSFAYTDPKKDVDVSHHMEIGGTVEGAITRIFRKIFNEKCDPAKNGGKRGLFVDVGANFGWFSVLAASMGCRVTAFEPVPHFHAFFEYSVHLNGLANLVDMRGNLISHISGSKLKMVVPNRGIWGTAGIDGLNIDQAIKGSVNKEIEVPSMKLDELIKEDVLLLKVDVEGWEWSVMQGAAKLISNYNVENVIMEYSPGVPERSFRTKEMSATVQMLINLADSGFRIAHIGDMNKHHAGGLDAPLPASEEVTMHNLLYDLVDAELFAGMLLGCPVPPLLANFSAWTRCQAMPEDPNPRSLRSLIGHNTNIWAAKKGSKIQVLKGVVGILPLEAPFSQFFVNYDGKETVFGMGSRLCKDLPPLVQVRHRCHCTNKALCGAEEEGVVKAVAANSIASNYVLTSTGKLVSGEGYVKKLLAKIGTARKLGEPYLPGAVKGMLTTN